nr:hypothetical protein [Tanacetum cinerariifolium]
VVDLTEDDDDDDDDDEDTDDIPDADVSFVVNIFLDGYTIDKSLKTFSCRRVPANFFEDIPCTYRNGKVTCEIINMIVSFWK